MIFKTVVIYRFTTPLIQGFTIISPQYVTVGNKKALAELLAFNFLEKQSNIRNSYEESYYIPVIVDQSQTLAEEDGQKENHPELHPEFDH